MYFRTSIFRNAALLSLSCIFSLSAYSQENAPANDYGQVHGNFQLDATYLPKADSVINFVTIPAEKALMNGFGNVTYTKGNFRAGARYEAYLDPLPGFDARYKGQGIPFRYAGYTVDNIDVTLGSFYEQFGNGLIFRSYEERALGFDNAMDGIRVKYNPYKGIYTKGFFAKQRQFFTTGAGLVRGFDGEVAINELIDSLLNEMKITVGGSFVSRYQADTDPDLVLPENVGSWAARFNVSKGKIAITGEYAYKINDPSLVNGMIYKPGEAAFLMGSYSQKGLGFSLAAKRIDNMNFRSDRNAQGNALTLNYLPALTKQHTYLLATFYPYATQPNGEEAAQAELVYTLKKGTALGGEYGTTMILNASAANSLDTNQVSDPYIGYSSDYGKVGSTNYFRDINVELSRKFTKKIKMNFLYAYQEYNKDVIQGQKGYGIIYSNILVADITYKFTSSAALRTELQHLSTKQDKGAWAAALMEFTVAPHWFVTALDMYNYGDPHKDKVHYYFATVGYVKNASRVSIGYGRQREGIYCVGGICRNVPATSGWTLSISTSF
jgi:hypothetical protein